MPDLLNLPGAVQPVQRHQEAHNQIAPQPRVLGVQRLVRHHLPHDGLGADRIPRLAETFAAPLADLALGEQAVAVLPRASPLGVRLDWLGFGIEHPQRGVDVRQIGAGLADAVLKVGDEAANFGALLSEGVKDDRLCHTYMLGKAAVRD